MALNQNIILVVGKSATGKTLSLRNLKNPEGVLYLCTEGNKALPFKSKFDQRNITDPMQVYQGFEWAEKKEHIHTIAIDTLTFLMDQYETRYVLTAQNTMQAWGAYAQYFKKLVHQYIAESTKNIIVLAHTTELYNEKELVMETLVKIKGSVMNQGVEAYFSNVISTKKIPLRKLKERETDLLVYTEDEEMLKHKHVFQTRLTEDTVNERIRSPLGMWDKAETYIDNDIQLVLDRIHHYYS